MIAEYSGEVAAEPRVSYLTTDHLGSPRVATDERGSVTSRRDFTAFGEESFTAQRTQGLGYQPTEIRQNYTGYEKDEESGLEYAQARYYNATHGRFTSVDPLTASATIRNPQTLNRYSYALNSPYKFTDPLGLLSQYTTGACGSNCPNSASRWFQSGNAGYTDNYAAFLCGAFECEQEKAPVVAATSPNASEPQPSQTPSEIPPPPTLKVEYLPAPGDTEAIINQKTSSLQEIANNLIAANWPTIYAATVAETAASRVPKGEMSQQTDTSSAQVGVSVGTDGADVSGQTGSSRSTTTEFPRTLEGKIAANATVINNSAVAVAASDAVPISNSVQFVGLVNKTMIDHARRLVTRADAASPPISGGLPHRRADPANIRIVPHVNRPIPWYIRQRALDSPY
ncbi:MAG TPA: RHS repeat-associated core domain-containing protein [Pyrinomonadaceae bacterium]|nr:RHS repeat-associated core domain-containing protein [Pyrinomonadaceae bacterium]